MAKLSWDRVHVAAMIRVYDITCGQVARGLSRQDSR